LSEKPTVMCCRSAEEVGSESSISLPMLGAGGGQVNHAYQPEEGRASPDGGGDSRITGSLHSDSSSPLPTIKVFYRYIFSSLISKKTYQYHFLFILSPITKVVLIYGFLLEPFSIIFFPAFPHIAFRKLSESPVFSLYIAVCKNVHINLIQCTNVSFAIDFYCYI
jgi:hypothetical protein